MSAWNRADNATNSALLNDLTDNMNRDQAHAFAEYMLGALAGHVDPETFARIANSATKVAVR